MGRKIPGIIWSLEHVLPWIMASSLKKILSTFFQSHLGRLNFVSNNIELQYTSGPRLVWFLVVRFSLVCCFKTLPKYLSHADYSSTCAFYFQIVRIPSLMLPKFNSSWFLHSYPLYLTSHSDFFHSKNSKNPFKCLANKIDSILSNYNYMGCQNAKRIEKRPKKFWRPKQRPDMEKIRIFKIFSAF